MPALDRRIIVRLSADVVNQFGETSTVTTDYPVNGRRALTQA